MKLFEPLPEFTAEELTGLKDLPLDRIIDPLPHLDMESLLNLAPCPDELLIAVDSEK